MFLIYILLGSQKLNNDLHVYNILRRHVPAAVYAFTSFACIWWSEHCRLYPVPATWAALKTAMRTRWVLPYYQRELLQKLQRLKQGKNSIEEYYQELQTGMIRCGIVEENEAMLARFMGGLNKEIQTILDYKEYTNITRLFHLACKAEREVQDRQALARTNFSAGRLMRSILRSSPWTVHRLTKHQEDPLLEHELELSRPR